MTNAHDQMILKKLRHLSPDRLYFTLSEDAFKRFTTMLDNPTPSNPKLRRLLQKRAPWER